MSNKTMPHAVTTDRKKWVRELKALWKEDLITADAVVEWARTHPSSDLHSKFEWDDTKAGHGYRIQQARILITRVRIYQDPACSRQTPFAIHVKALDRNGYRKLNSIKAGDILLEEGHRLLSHLERACMFDGLRKLSGVQAAIRDVKAMLSKLEVNSA